jgi:UTP--glucose-1-phosphate uridylyltransferase
VNVYCEFGASVLCAIKAQSDADFTRYGFAGGTELREGLLDVKSLIEKPGSREAAPSDYATVSGFVLTPDIFGYLHKAHAEMHDGNELYYNDALKLMLADGKRVLAREVPNARYYDAGDKLEYVKTVADFALRRDDIGPAFAAYLRTRLGGLDK